VDNVLGLARTGLIFTGIQEGPQLGGVGGGGLTPPGQTEQGIPYHVPLCWVPVGGSWGAGTYSRLGRAQQWCSLRKRFFSAGLFCVFPFLCIVVVTVPFVCCSIKLPLSRHTSFSLFISILLRTPAGGGAATRRFYCRLRPKPEH